MRIWVYTQSVLLIRTGLQHVRVCLDYTSSTASLWGIHSTRQFHQVHFPIFTPWIPNTSHLTHCTGRMSPVFIHVDMNSDLSLDLQPSPGKEILCHLRELLMRWEIKWIPGVDTVFLPQQCFWDSTHVLSKLLIYCPYCFLFFTEF